MENKLSLAAFCIICATILSCATDPRNIHDGKSFSQPDKLGRIVPDSTDWLQSKTDKEDTDAKLPEGTDSFARNKRSVVGIFKSWIRIKRALKFLRKDGILVSSASHNQVWVKLGGVRRADKDLIKVNPDDVSYTTKNGVTTATGNFEGGKLVFKEDLDTHACTIVLSRVLKDGSTFRCTVRYVD